MGGMDDELETSENNTSSHGVRTPKRNNKRRGWLVASLLFAILLIAAGLIFWLFIRNDPIKTVFSREQLSKAKAVNADIYYPTSLPDGFTVIADSLDVVDSEVITYSIINTRDNQHLFLSFQKKPDKSIIDSMFRGVSDKASIDTALGTATTAYISKRQIASIPVDNTWLIVSTVDAIETVTLLTIINSMKKL